MPIYSAIRGYNYFTCTYNCYSIQLSENNLGQFNAQKLSQTLYDDQLSKKFFEEYQKNCPNEDSGDDPAAIQRICQEMGIARSLAIMPLIMGNAREDHTGEMFLREASIFLPVGRVIILRLFKTHFLDIQMTK